MGWHRLTAMYNWALQDAIAAFVESQKPYFQMQHEIYLAVLHGFVAMQSQLLTLLGFPPVP